MNDAEIDEVLVGTWDDHQLSRAERKALKEVVDGVRRTDDERHRFRHRGFELARGFLAEAPSGEVLAWLEEVVRALWPPVAEGPAAAPAEALLLGQARRQQGRELAAKNLSLVKIFFGVFHPRLME